MNAWRELTTFPLAIMLSRLAIIAWTLAAVVASCGDSARAFVVDDRWGRTATQGPTGPSGTAVTLTWSFAPNGTIIPIDVNNNLLTFLDTNLGVGPGGSDLTQRPWFGLFEQSFARISELSGVTYVYEAKDNGVDFSSNLFARGVLNTRGDIRIGGKSFGAGSNTLASNYPPDYGEMVINTDQTAFYTNSSNNYRSFRNTVMHEALHGLGIGHAASDSFSFLMEPQTNSTIDGPQLDDLLAIHRLYGDWHEKNGGNDSFDRATNLGAVSASQALVVGTDGDRASILPDESDFLSISGAGDADLFSFTVNQPLDVSLSLTPKGVAYQVGYPGGAQSTYESFAANNLSLALLDTDGTSVLSLADANPAGQGEAISFRLGAGAYFARVRGAQDTVQFYQLEIAATPPVMQLPGDYNGDGVVDIADYSLWRDTLGSSENLAADGDGSGAIDEADYAVWKQNFGTTIGELASANSVVPEPSAGALFGFLGCSLFAARRAKSGRDSF